MSETTSRNQRSDESRHRILKATLELAAEKGYEGTTIAQVSKRSGLPSGSVYWHFENKDKLFASLLEHSVEAWERRQDWQFRPGELPQDRVRAAVAVRAQEATEDTSFWRLGLLLTLERRLSGTAAREMFLQIRSTRLATMIDWWNQVLPEQVQDRDPLLARRLSQFTMAAADGMYIAISAGDDWDTAALADMLTDSLTHLVEAAGASLAELPS
ncbi:TetR/AcrR family transcriptional regulator [Streptomyces sp. NPDC052052]|uniref:TetR/AcrR family transcriptional regulator n=1 Tax=Streptomyces sp. NPDC052052 TaxID=3154756 RepID=UPI00343153F9